MTRALGLDLGSKRIGVAISDSAGTVATPVDTIHRQAKRADYQRIALLVEEWEAELVVVGLPYSLDGSCIASYTVPIPPDPMTRLMW